MVAYGFSMLKVMSYYKNAWITYITCVKIIHLRVNCTFLSPSMLSQGLKIAWSKCEWCITLRRDMNYCIENPKKHGKGLRVLRPFWYMSFKNQTSESWHLCLRKEAKLWPLTIMWLVDLQTFCLILERVTILLIQIWSLGWACISRGEISSVTLGNKEFRQIDRKNQSPCQNTFISSTSFMLCDQISWRCGSCFRRHLVNSNQSSTIFC